MGLCAANCQTFIGLFNRVIMRILSIHLYKWQQEAPIQLCCAHELGFLGYLKRSTVRDLLNFNSRTCCGRSRPNDRTAIHLEQDVGICYLAIHPNTLGVTVITDPEYPQRVAFTLIAEILRQFQALGLDWGSLRADANLPFPELATQLQRYQNPAEADRLTKIQSELNQVTEVMHRNIEELMKRGETLESLMARSEDLSGVSYDFYKRAKKNNQCCKLY